MHDEHGTPVKHAIKAKCEACANAAGAVNAVLSRMAYFQHLTHDIDAKIAKARSDKIKALQPATYLKNNAAPSIARDRKIIQIHNDAKKFDTQVQKLQQQRNDTKAKLKQFYIKHRNALTAYYDCVKKYCKPQVGMLDDSDGDKPQHASLPGGFTPNAFTSGLAAGVLVSYDSSKRDGSIANEAFDTVTGLSKKTGIGVSLLMQYYFMSNPAWFIFSSAAYPGDRDNQVVKGLTDPFSQFDSHLTVTKKWIVNTGVGRNIFTLGNCSNRTMFSCVHFALGLGLAAIHQTYQGVIGELGETMINQQDTTVSPMAMFETITAVTPNIGLLLGVMVNSLPSKTFAAYSLLDNHHDFRIKSAVEYQLNLGLKYFFNSLDA